MSYFGPRLSRLSLVLRFKNFMKKLYMFFVGIKDRMMKSYSELRQYVTFSDRFNYLLLGGSVGHATFGFDRYLNQDFYRSVEWKSAREQAIIRDNGCDLGIPGYEIHAELLVHHMNPMTSDDIAHNEAWILDPEFLITTTHRTHNDIHYGNANSTVPQFVERMPGDTTLW